MRFLLWIIPLIAGFFIKKAVDPQMEKLMSNLARYQIGGIDINGK